MTPATHEPLNELYLTEHMNDEDHLALWLKSRLRWFEMVSLGRSLSEQFSHATCFPVLTVAVFPAPQGKLAWATPILMCTVSLAATSSHCYVKS